MVFSSCRGDSQIGVWWYVWWFSPHLVSLFLFLTVLVFIQDVGEITQERRFDVYSRSPLSGNYQFYNTLITSHSLMSGRLHRSIFYYTLVLPSMKPKSSFLNFLCFWFCAFCCFTFEVMHFVRFDVFEYFDIFTKWGPMVDRWYSIGGQDPILCIYIV